MLCCLKVEKLDAIPTEKMGCPLPKNEYEDGFSEFNCAESIKAVLTLPNAPKIGCVNGFISPIPREEKGVFVFVCPILKIGATISNNKIDLNSICIY